jgi:hypothetical protein
VTHLTEAGAGSTSSRKTSAAAGPAGRACSVPLSGASAQATRLSASVQVRSGPSGGM